MSAEKELRKIGLETWDKAKSQVHERLLSSEWYPNLEDIVRIRIVGDIWRTFYVQVTDDTIAGITYGMMFFWDIAIEDLIAAARENDAGSYTVQSMGSIVKEIFEDDEPELPAPGGMTIVTNKSRNLGAAGILDGTVQATLARLFPRGALIALSSVHECIAVDVESIEPVAYASMVHDINREEVAESERLSDHVFTLADGKLLMVA